MKHIDEGDLILFYYGEGRRRAHIERHLEACATCATAYRDLAGTLSLIVEPAIPDRGDRYGLEVWQRIRHQLPEQDAAWWMAWGRWDRLGLAAAAAVLVMAAFAAGRIWPRAEPARPAAVQAPGQAIDEASDSGDRVRGAAIGDHLERSERVLLDLINASGAKGAQVDVREQQAWAEDLLASNVLYRQAATRAGDTLVATVLDDLERNLLEIVHGPSTLTPAQLEQMRVRLDAAALLFKVRVLHDELREREIAPATPRKTT